MLDHAGSPLSFTNRRSILRARHATIHHRARLATVPCPFALQGDEPPPGLPSPPHTGSGGLREACPDPGVRLRLLADLRRGVLGHHPQTQTRRADRSRRNGRVGRDGARVLRPSRRPGTLGGGRGLLLRHQGTEGGGEKAGRSPVDRGKRGMKRSVVVDAAGIPLGAVAAPAKAATIRRFWRPPWALWRRSGYPSG